jgi:hypothetical protein
MKTMSGTSIDAARSTMRSKIRLFACLLSGVWLAGGCAEGDVCKALGACGGNPVGGWTLKTGPASCQLPVYQPPRDIWLFGRGAPVARQPPPEPAYSDQCHGLVYDSNREKPVSNRPFFPSEEAPYGEARIKYTDDGHYEASFVRTGVYALSFSRTCMRQYGSDADCQTMEGFLNPMDGQDGEGTATKVQCKEGAEPGSCDCSFEPPAVKPDRGLYAITGSEITHYSQAHAMFPAPATFCVKGDDLQLTGSRGLSLYNRAGLRTMELQRVNCDDGEQGPGEEGVDCGLVCPNACGEAVPERDGP